MPNLQIGQPILNAGHYAQQQIRQMNRWAPYPAPPQILVSLTKSLINKKTQIGFKFGYGRLISIFFSQLILDPSKLIKIQRPKQAGFANNGFHIMFCSLLSIFVLSPLMQGLSRPTTEATDPSAT